MKYLVRIALFSLVLVSLVGCDTLSGFGKDNTPDPSPLVAFTPKLQVTQLWDSSTTDGSGDEYLRMPPTVSGDVIYTSGNGGEVSANNRMNGDSIWRTDVDKNLLTGVGVGEGKVFVVADASSKAPFDMLVALDAKTGQILWQKNIPNQALATPVVADGRVFVETIDGKLIAFDTNTAKQLWLYDHQAPALLLRTASRPVAYNGNLYVGFSDGKMVSIKMENGRVNWELQVSQPQGDLAIQRMIDIDTTPIIDNGNIYVANYQGNISVIDAASGQASWQKPYSTYSQIALSDNNIFLTDPQSIVSAYSRDAGKLVWHEDGMKYRVLTGPAIMGNSTIVMGDGEGYVHWLSAQDGQEVAREKLSSHTIVATPVVVGDIVYVVDSEGLLSAYKVNA